MNLTELAQSLGINDQIPEYAYSAYEKAKDSAFPLTMEGILKIQAPALLPNMPPAAV